MRCLVLADKLRKNGYNIIFICKNEKGNINNIINKNYKIYILKSNNTEEIKRIITKNKLQVKWLIIDHYDLDYKFENQMCNHVNNIMVIDDLANRKHYCDVLLDQNLSNNFDRYNHLIPQNCKLFLGLKYLLLRDEFENTPKRIRNTIKNILVFFGGSDDVNETMKVLESLEPLKNINVDVVVGNSNVNKYIIRYLCYKYNFNFYKQINNIAELINKADLAIGSGGTSLWERCYLGLPSIVAILANNQINSVKNAEKLNCIINLGYYKNIKPEDYYNIITNLISEEIEYMSNNCLNLFKENKVGELIDYIKNR